MPKVSVIIPNYNHARYLPRRIDSVLQQTYGDFEVLLMDDQSPDDSLDVLRRYAGDSRVRTLFNDVNSGSTFKQWNKGLANTGGEYVWLAESDDWADPRLLERLVARLDAHPNVGIAYCQSWIVDEHDNLLKRHDPLLGELNRHWDHDFVADGRTECAEYMSLGNTIPNASAAVFRREVYERVGGPDESAKVCGDWKLWAKMLCAADVAFVAEPLNYFRTHQANVRTKMAFGTSSGLVETFEAVRDVFAASDPSPVARRRSLDRWADLWFGNLLRGQVTREQHRRLLRLAGEIGMTHPYLRMVGILRRRGVGIVRSGRAREWLTRFLPEYVATHVAALRGKRRPPRLEKLLGPQK